MEQHLKENIRLILCKRTSVGLVTSRYPCFVVDFIDVYKYYRDWSMFDLASYLNIPSQIYYFVYITLIILF